MVFGSFPFLNGCTARIELDMQPLAHGRAPDIAVIGETRETLNLRLSKQSPSSALPRAWLRTIVAPFGNDAPK